MERQRFNKLTVGDILKWWSISLLLLSPFCFMTKDLTNSGYMFYGFYVPLVQPYYLAIFIIFLFRKQKTVLEYDGETVSVIGIRFFIRYTIIKFKVNSISKISFYGKKTVYVYIEGFCGKLCNFKARYNDEVCCFLSGLGKKQEWGGKARKYKYGDITLRIIFFVIFCGCLYYEFLYHYAGRITEQSVRLYWQELQKILN